MMTLAELHERFPDEDACMAFLVGMRWPSGVCCPRCGAEKVHKLARPWKWQCKQCAKNGYRFSPLVGTIFENTNYDLRVWFEVIYLMCQSKKGISALQIHRMIGSGSYRTAWYMCHRIRAAMDNPEFRQLSGIVEVDETYIGGKARNRHGRGIGRNTAGRVKGKVAVIGALARKGKVIAQVIDDTKQSTLRKFVHTAVHKQTKLMVTDEHHGYRGLDRLHKSVNHSKRQYVRGVVHTANIDSFWSFLKRGIVGSFHTVSKEYLPFYLAEFSFRYNNRKSRDMFSQVIAAC